LLSSTRSRRSYHQSDPHAATQADLERWRHRADAWRFEIGDDDEILARHGTRLEHRAHAATERQAPRCFVEGIEEKTRNRVDSCTIVIDAIDSRDACGTDELQSHIYAERDVRADATLQRSRVDRPNIDRVDAQLERRQRRTRGLRGCARRKCEREKREQKWLEIQGARKLGIAASAFQRACHRSARGLAWPMPPHVDRAVEPDGRYPDACLATTSTSSPISSACRRINWPIVPSSADWSSLPRARPA